MRRVYFLTLRKDQLELRVLIIIFDLSKELEDRKENQTCVLFGEAYEVALRLSWNNFWGRDSFTSIVHIGVFVIIILCKMFVKTNITKNKILRNKLDSSVSWIKRERLMQ